MSGKRGRRSWGARAAFTALVIQAGPLGAGLLVWAQHSEQRRAPGVIIRFQMPGGLREVRSFTDRAGTRLAVLDRAARMVVLQMRGADIEAVTVEPPAGTDLRLDYTMAPADTDGDGLIDLGLYRNSERQNELLLIARRVGGRYVAEPPPSHLLAGSTQRPNSLTRADGTTFRLELASGQIATRMGLPERPTCQVVPGLPAVVADFDADGSAELVTVDLIRLDSEQTRIRLFAFVGERLQQVWETCLEMDRALMRTCSEGPGPLICENDLDNDGRPELVVATTDGQIRVHRWYAADEKAAASPRRPRLRGL
ncbi:MAG: hypothetical protein HUU35_03475 [Armatimonadetes bacterium]|nr:hypothetical protein [Armatimonadota bacterium]